MMTLAIYIKKKALLEDPRTISLKNRLSALGFALYDVACGEDLRPGTEMILSLGGDGTFLCAARLFGGSGIPILGVNFGRLGFLSENTADDVVSGLSRGDYSIEERTLLESGGQYALNEVAIHRQGGAMLGIRVCIDGRPLPVYWADGMLVATSSGSTAYSLSVGGPICMPGSRVLIITPIAPHNLNVRPLIVPDTCRIEISVKTRDERFILSLDNNSTDVAPDTLISVGVAQFSLKRVRLHGSDFVKALTSKLFWGEDVRNSDDDDK